MSSPLAITVIYGGRSTEHEVSLSSASGVFRELSSSDAYQVTLIGASRTGGWYLQDSQAQLSRATAGLPLSIEEDENQQVLVKPGGGLIVGAGEVIPIDCIFPLIHGSFGEDGTLQGLFEMISVPYVGSGVTGSAVGMDKLRTKQLWQQNGLPVVPYCVGYPDETNLEDRIINTMGLPVFVKPNAAGSSIGITRVTEASALAAALHRAFTVDRCVLIEAAYPIREIETAVLGNRHPQAFPPGEVVPTHEFYDYEAKYNDPAGASLFESADLPAGVRNTIMDICVQAFLAVDAAGFARVDCFLHVETGDIYLNEINTIPGFTPISMYPRMVQASGMSYRELLDKLIGYALERNKDQAKRITTAR